MIMLANGKILYQDDGVLPIDFMRRGTMRRILALALTVLVGLISLNVAAQDATAVPEAQPNTPILLGQLLTATTTNIGDAGVVSFDLTLANATYITISARTHDSTDPAFRLTDPFGRELIVINDNPVSSAAIDPKDAVYDNTMLLAGTYRLDIARVDEDLLGSGVIDVLVEEGAGDILGIGKISVLDLTVGLGETLRVPLTLEKGEIVSMAAMGLTDGFDLRLNLRDASDVRVATNDDNETFDLFLGTTDPRIHKFIVPESQTYTLVVRPFSSNLSGDIRLVIQRHGRLAGEQTSDFLLGALENRQRTALTVNFERGEIIRLTTRADSLSLDPEILLLDPESIVVTSNDDHGTAATDLGRFDARVDQLVIEKSGTYELDVTSVSGRGDFEVEVTRLGVFSPATEPIVIDPASVISATPEPRPTEVSPEVTAEPTASS